MKLRACLVLLPLVACGTNASNGFPGPDSGSGVMDAAPAPDEDANIWISDAGALDGGDAASDANCATLNIGIFGNPGYHSSSSFQSWLVASGTSTTRLQQAPGDVITAQVLAPFDVVVLDWLQHDHSPAEAAALEAWVLGGKGLVVMSGYDNTVKDFRANALTLPLGVVYNSAALLNGPATNFQPHPVTAGLTSVSFLGGYEILTANVQTTRTPLAYIGAKPVAYAVEAGKGKAFVWGDEWIQFDSEWSMIPQVQALWVNVFKWVGPKEGCELKPPPPPK